MTFLQPLFLFGIVFAGVPIIIHLWFQKKLKKIPFSTLQFLKSSEVKKFGWLRFREILVLILRCLFVALLFLGLARPKLQRGILGIGRMASVVIIVDNSYSMAYGKNFLLAKVMTREILSLYSSNSEFCILPLCTSGRAEKPSWVLKKSASQLIEKLNISHKNGVMRDITMRLPERKPQYQVEYLYIGDGQATTFKDFPEALVENGTFYWVKIPTGGNVGITNVFLKDPVAIPVDEYSLIVELTNFSSKMWNGSVRISSDVYSFEQRCEVQPRQHTQLEFLLPVVFARGQVEIFTDSLSIDNVYFFMKSLPKTSAILIVGHDEYLHLALHPHDIVQSPFMIQSMNTLERVDLRKFNIVILNGVEEISESDQVRLDNFLRRENVGVMCFLGRKVGDNLRHFISSCCQVKELVIPKGYATIEWIDYNHQVFSIFLGTTTLKNIKFYHFQELVADRGVIASMSGNYPLVVVHNNMAVIATQFTPQSTDIVYKTAFIPLVYRLLMGLVTTPLNREFYIGDKMTSFQRLKTPRGEYLVQGDEFRQPGFYGAGDDTIAVNVNPDEGNLAVLGNERAHILNIHTTTQESIVGSDLTIFFLFLSLLAIVVETLLLFIK
ncbi:hypothetical protein AMJ52_00500 [candidate division TA06 bacterium DG_78]|uniref:Aerotolerance regulator N-terminal domain-containing protein n=1 Tax=candidate division TA06 bacterium DG_78 TaxID=1703772 RepID=A0A0S7YI67_UNCT6|nr:MAG: hypothetical protein AMJ52_00500 [candidate division TA06 bacterium DG_78]